jgi:hypothetical protein
MKCVAIPFIFGLILVSACSSSNRTSSAQAAYGTYRVVPAKLKKEKKVKVKYSNPKGYARSKRGAGR